MAFLQRVPRTTLARKTRQVLQAVQKGQTAIIESHGQPEVAILDIADYRILRAVMRFHAHKVDIDPDHGLSDETVAKLEDPQAQYNLVLTYYLQEGISLERTAELLHLPWLDLRLRFLRLDVPILSGPESSDELIKEIDAIMKWETEHGQQDPSR